MTSRDLKRSKSQQV